MKKYLAILFLIGLLIPAIPTNAQGGKQSKTKSATTSVKDSKQRKKTVIKQGSQIKIESQADVQRKKAIEAKELTVNKNKKVRRFDLDENISTVIRDRNIP